MKTTSGPNKTAMHVGHVKATPLKLSRNLGPDLPSSF